MAGFSINTLLIYLQVNSGLLFTSNKTIAYIKFLHELFHHDWLLIKLNNLIAGHKTNY